MSDRFDEGIRAAAIEDRDLGGSPADLNFDELTRFAAALCGTPIALVSLVEEKRQRFLSKLGLAVCETPREVSFCAHAMCGPDVMVVPDALEDPRFADNPLVTNAPFIRFYAGAPLITDDGVPLGSVCVIDDKPRAGLSELQLQGLKLLARQVMAKFETRRTEKATWLHEIAAKQTLAESEQKFQILADAMPQMVWSTLPDGNHDYYNARWYEFTGVPKGSTDGEGWNGMFHPDDQERAWEKWRHSLATGEPYEIEYRLRNASGAYRWTLGRALPMRDKAGQITRWFGTCTDIHDQKMLMEQHETISQELSHRIKNIFAVVGGLIAFSSRAHPDMAPFAGELRARVVALGKAHDFVRPHSARSRPAGNKLTLRGLLSELLSAYQDANSLRISISGDDVWIDDRSATPLALVFHELATNAAKYGALSSLTGHVEIGVSVSDAEVTVTWDERGGPEVLNHPNKVGFGSRLIELAIESQLNGRLAQSWNLTGLSAVAIIPLASISP